MYICNMLLYVLLSCWLGMINASGNHTSVVRVRRVQYPFWIFILVFRLYRHWWSCLCVAKWHQQKSKNVELDLFKWFDVRPNVGTMFTTATT